MSHQQKLILKGCSGAFQLLFRSRVDCVPKPADSFLQCGSFSGDHDSARRDAGSLSWIHNVQSTPLGQRSSCESTETLNQRCPPSLTLGLPWGTQRGSQGQTSQCDGSLGTQEVRCGLTGRCSMRKAVGDTPIKFCAAESSSTLFALAFLLWQQSEALLFSVNLDQAEASSTSCPPHYSGRE